MGEWLKPPVC